MRIESIKLTKFRRFANLEVKGIPPIAKLVVLAGPNGSGKSSLFDALLLRYRLDANVEWNNDSEYYNRSNDPPLDIHNRIAVTRHGGGSLPEGAVYIRTAYRSDAEFITKYVVAARQHLGQPKAAASD